MIRYSYEKFYTDIRQIATWVETWDEVSTPSLQWDPHLIISIARGGLVPGVYLSHMLGVRNKPVVWQTRDGKINETINIDSSEILIIDDINDTGVTFDGVVDDIMDHNDIKRGKIKTVSLWTRHSSKFKVDFTTNNIDNDEWVVFPWEQTGNI